MPIEQARHLQQQRVAALQTRLAALPLEGAAPLTLEIGCGHGHFLTAYAAQHPHEHCLAIDLLRERLERAERKSQRLALANLHWLQAEANDLLAAWPPDVRITRHIFILFPDPWPKRRHWKHRLLQAPFLTALAARTAPGARLCFRTDHEDYFAAAHTELAAHPDWTLLGPEAWPFETPTVFERRAPSFQSAVAARR